MKKRWIWMSGGIAIIGGSLWLIARPDPVRVESAEVRRGPLVATVEEQGQTRARDRYTVAAPITGRLLRTAVDEGHRVTEGDVLATMAPPPEDPRTEATIRAELTAAEARMREAEAVLSEAASNETQARREAERRASLFEQGAVSVETRETFERAARSARARLDTARASLRAARAEVERARSRLLGVGSDTAGGAGEGARGTVAVRAPASGTVMKVHEESERVVQAGTPLFELGEGRGLELVVDLLTEDAVQVEPGDAVEVTGWGGAELLEGRVRYIEPQAFTEVSALGVEEQRVNVIGDLLSPPPTLGSGYRIEAAIVVWSANDVLVVPQSAIFRRAGGFRVYAIEDGVARLRVLEVGHLGRAGAEVLAGLGEGDEVILFPSDLIADGVRVAPRKHD